MAQKTRKKSAPIKEFDIRRNEKGQVGLMINTGVFWLDQDEKDHLAVCLNRAISEVLTCPIASHGMFLLYDDGRVAAHIAFSKIDSEGEKFLAVVMYNKPTNKTSRTDMYYLPRAAVDRFLLIVSDHDLDGDEESETTEQENN
jgi:hypothetical protein